MQSEIDRYGPPPKGRTDVAKSSNDERGALIECDLVRCGQGNDVAWNLSHALYRLDLAVRQRDTSPISASRRRSLLEALTWAHLEILGLFPGAEQAFAAKGFEAAIGLICTWAETPEQRATRHQHVLLDMLDHARILRNLAHNISLIEYVRERASDRRSDTVKELLRKAAA